MTREKAIKSLQFVRNALTDGMEIAKAYDMAIESLKQEPTTKNDLGVDCISRADARKAIIEYQYSDSFCEEHNIDHSINTSMALLALSDLPSVTPQPRKGHWIAHEVRLPDRTILNYRCSVCGRKLIGYSTETLSEAPYCHCGARMVESQESEDKE